MTDRDRVRWLLTMAHLHEVEAAPRASRARYPTYYGCDVDQFEHYPLPTLADLFSLGEEHREAMTQARAIGVTAGDHARVRSWFAGGNRAEREARERRVA